MGSNPILRMLIFGLPDYQFISYKLIWSRNLKIRQTPVSPIIKRFAGGDIFNIYILQCKFTVLYKSSISLVYVSGSIPGSIPVSRLMA